MSNKEIATIKRHIAKMPYIRYVGSGYCVDWAIIGRYSCGGRTRTCDLQVMSLASYQLLHSAIFLVLRLQR